MDEEAAGKYVADAIERHREIVREELAQQAIPIPHEAVVREIHGDLKVVARIQATQLTEAVKTNNRISGLEQWRDKILGAVGIMVLFSPLFVYEIRQWLATTIGG